MTVLVKVKRGQARTGNVMDLAAKRHEEKTGISLPKKTDLMV